MFRKDQKEQNGLPKEMQKLAPLLGMIPKSQIESQFKRVWKKKTKVFDDPKKNIKPIKKLQTAQTKKLFYKEITVYTWLQKIIQGQETKETIKFINWYKTEYYKISLKDLGIF